MAAPTRRWEGDIKMDSGIYILTQWTSCYGETFVYWSHASLCDGNTFWEMRRWGISSLCEHHRVYLHKPKQYSLLNIQSIWYNTLLLGYKPVQHVTVLNTVGNCNTIESIVIYYYLMGPTSYIRSIVWPKRRYAAHDCITPTCFG